jgi:D-cysteine desulfhydrase
MPSLLASVWPALGERLDHVALGEFPTPVQRLTALEAVLGVGPLYVKRDDISAEAYGGNKVRTLEVLFGAARAAGAREIVATGAFGSNHAVATVLHAPRAGLRSGAVLFPQPASFAALENLRVTLARADKLVVLPHWSFLPFGMWRARGPHTRIMLPGGATPTGALGYVAAAFELAEQVARGELDEPRRVYVGIGSTCTTAGLVLGFVHAARLGLGFRRAPEVVAVRVTPWPVTSRFRILGLAARAGQLLAKLTNDPSLALRERDLTGTLVLDGRQLGPGYGEPSPSGLEALALFRERGLFALDTTYSSKAAAGFLAGARERPGEPAVFWSTKSTQPLPSITEAELAAAPYFARRWIERAHTRVTPP